MKHLASYLLIGLLGLISIPGQTQRATDIFPIKGFAIGAPKPTEVDRFIKFINDELAAKQINTLILRVDYNFQFESYPQLRDSIALSKSDVKKIVTACKQHNINIIPQINLLGHQSWAGRLGNLLKQYPAFDETPDVKMPAKYVWPNDDGLYCKSYCPLHPDVHKIVFALMDEICTVFEAKAFHAGMDEVFYIGDPRCPRCGGVDKAELFGNEVTMIADHLASNQREMWIWGDRLIDGKTTGLGMWEASMNNTFHAIDRMPKSVVICDWHYERPDQTAVYFAMKGFRVVTCPWNKPKIAAIQVEDMARFHLNASAEMQPRFYGMVQTVWSGVGNFLDGYYNDKSAASDTPWESFRIMTQTMQSLQTSVK